MTGRSYIGVGLALGVALGTSLGLVFDNLAMGIALGTALGVAFGAVMDSKKRTQRHSDDADTASKSDKENASSSHEEKPN